VNDSATDARVDRRDRRRPWSSLPTEWLLGGLFAAAWILRYAARYGLDPARPPDWIHWFDQDKYILSARALAAGNLSADAHWYALGYPLIGAASGWLVPGSPYFVADGLLFALTGLGFRRAMRPLGIGTAAAVVIFLLTTLGTVKLLWLVPWSTTLSAALIWWLLALALETLLPETDASPTLPPRNRMIAIGALAGALPLSRIADGLVSGLVLGIVACTLLRQRRLTASGVMWLAAGALALCLPYLALHLAIYGARATPYATAAANTGFVFGDLPWKGYVLLITPQPWYPNCQSLIEALPWLVSGAAGLTVAGFTLERKARWALGLIVLTAIPYALLALAYRDLHPPGLWHFNNAHYFKWLFPLLGTGLWLWLQSFRSRRGAAAAIGALMLWLAPACIRLVPRNVADAQPARMLLFRGSDLRSWHDAYFAPATITDSRGTLDNTAQFHQVPDEAGERALAITRPFAEHPLRDDPGETAGDGRAEPPYARYGERISLGLPCWFERSACVMPPPPPAPSRDPIGR
jgi:hypothetical protein